MLKYLISLLLILTIQPLAKEHTIQTIYDFKVKTITGKETTLEPYKGKVMLIVNVASKCGYTR
jgi:glutathione peroxidase